MLWLWLDDTLKPSVGLLVADHRIITPVPQCVSTEPGHDFSACLYLF